MLRKILLFVLVLMLIFPSFSLNSQTVEEISRGKLIALALNFKYTVSDKKYQLKDGYYEQFDPAEDRATIEVVDLALDDLNGDKRLDVAVILASNFGGSGHFYELTALISKGNQYLQSNNIELGDRIKIECIKIEQNRIILDMVVHGPNDPMCCPSQRVTQEFELKGNRLKKVK